MTRLQFTILSIALVWVPLVQYLFRFHRVTRWIGQAYFRSDCMSAQIIMTPPWLGVFGYVLLPDEVALAMGFLFSFGCVAFSLWTIYVFLGQAMLDFILPIPAYAHCLSVAEHATKTDNSTPGAVKIYILEAISQERQARRSRY